MISIVIVSHSLKLAEGIHELAQQMVRDQVPIAIAGGTDNPDEPIGTDPMHVLAAIEAVYSDDGVLVLMDLGSALMSAEAALEFLPAEQQANIYLCEAPLVEGVMAAAVQAMTGSPIARVYDEARNALTAKTQQLEPVLRFKPEAPTSPAQIATPAASMLTEAITIVVPNALGLHARPAARLVETVSQFAADMQIAMGDRTADARSINQIAMLGTRQGDTLHVTASGADAQPALDALQALVEANFGDPINAPAAVESDKPNQEKSTVNAQSTQTDQLAGIPVCTGIAIGPVIDYRPQLPTIDERHIEDAAAEIQRLDTAIAAALADLEDVYTTAARHTNPDDAAIFRAHMLMLRDVDLLDAANARIQAEQINAEAAWHHVYEAVAAQYRALDNAYLRARGDDVVDVGQRVLRHLLQIEDAPVVPTTPGILVTPELTPSLAAQLAPSQVLGIITEQGGATGHGALLARALSIPTVVGVPNALALLAARQPIALDGTRGLVWIEPNAEDLTTLQAERDNWLVQRNIAAATSHKLAQTQDGHHIEVAANIGRAKEIHAAIAAGAEGVGLFRTEFLFMDRVAAPTEDEQFAAYVEVAQALGERPLLIRTLDVGGDKPITYLPFAHEENPFLGWRGIRFCLEMPDIFRPQLRAILRASAHGNVKIMFPMVSTVEEVRRARVILLEVQAELRAAGFAFNEQIDVGIMIEVPAAVWQADRLAQAVDFFSIGTNDLTQYIMAADRGNARVAGLVNALQPAVLSAIQQVVAAAHNAGIWVGMCGELAGNAQATALLVGLGVDELSMSASAIPQVKQVIRQLNVEIAQTLAQEALTTETSEGMQRLLAEASP